MNSTLVSVQTLRGTAGKVEALKAVEAAVTKHNAENPGADQHIVAEVTALPNNTKGMQWQLSLLATLARMNGATMVRLNVHNGQVALCGPEGAVEATRNAMVPAYNKLSTLAAATYSAATDGNRVGWTNGFLCGTTAGLQDAFGVANEVAYGIGFLFNFPKPGTGLAYDQGYATVRALEQAPAEQAPAPTPAKRGRKPRQQLVEQAA